MVRVATVTEADANASDADAEIVGNNRTGGDHKSRRFSLLINAIFRVYQQSHHTVMMTQELVRRKDK